MRGGGNDSGSHELVVCGCCLFALVTVLLLFSSLPVAAATAESIEYPDGAKPDSATAGQIIDLAIAVRNEGTETLSGIWISLDIYTPGGIKVESNHGDYSNGLIYWNEQDATIAPASVQTFTARYSLNVSSTGHAFRPADYTLQYAAWRGQPGAPGAEQIGQLQSDILSVGAIPTPATVVPILMYHRVDDESQNEYWVPVNEFDAQMKVLTAYGYHPISTQDIYEYNYAGGLMPDKPVVITFDDGYEDLYTHAYPVLLREGLFGEAFVITDYVGFSASDRRYVRLFLSVPLVYPHLTWPEIIEMAANGMIFGSHTKTHRDLLTLTESEVQAELRDSKQALLDYAGISATSFSYPYGSGDDDPQIQQLLAQYGYSTAVSAWRGLEQTSTAMPLDLKRVYIYGPHPAAQPDSNGVSVDYDPNHPSDFFMTQLEPDFPVPLIAIDSVEVLDEAGNPRENNVFYRGETVMLRVHARNDGPANDVVLSLQLDNDAGTEPVQYSSHQQSEDITWFFDTTNVGSEEIFDFFWQIPPSAPVGAYDYSVKFHDRTYTLGFASSGWVTDQFRICDDMHLLQPVDGASLRSAPTFVWDPGCNDRYVVEFSFDPSFASARRTPILSTPSFSMPSSIWRSAPIYQKIYWRVRGTDSVIEPTQINTSAETRYFQRAF